MSRKDEIKLRALDLRKVDAPMTRIVQSAIELAAAKGHLMAAVSRLSPMLRSESADMLIALERRLDAMRYSLEEPLWARAGDRALTLDLYLTESVLYRTLGRVQVLEAR